MSNVIVTGPGKCGGSLLMQLFTEMGMDTGYFKGRTFKNNDAGGNYEWQTRGTRAIFPLPYIIKEPQMCADIDLRIEKLDLTVDHIYILLRRPGPEAVALEFMRRGSSKKDMFERGLNGRDLDRVTSLVAHREVQVINLVAEMDTPHTLVSYPRFASDYEYAYDKFKFLMDRHKISFDMFTDVCDQIIDTEQVDFAYTSQPEWNRAKMREAWDFRGRLS